VFTVARRRRLAPSRTRGTTPIVLIDVMLHQRVGEPAPANLFPGRCQFRPRNLGRVLDNPFASGLQWKALCCCCTVPLDRPAMTRVRDCSQLITFLPSTCDPCEPPDSLDRLWSPDRRGGARHFVPERAASVIRVGGPPANAVIQQRLHQDSARPPLECRPRTSRVTNMRI